LEVNEGWEKLFGYSREEAVGRTPIELGLYANLGDRPGMMSQLQRQGFLRNYELEVQTRRGEIRQVSLSAEAIVIGEEQCLITIMRDITEQKQAEHDLQVSEREFRAMFELAGSGKIQVDPITSRFLRVNQRYCEITGYSQEELLNKLTAAEVTHPDDREKEHEVVWPVRQGLRDHWQLEKRYLRKDGQVVWALVTGSLIRDETGRPLHTIATVQDITDLKETETALRRAHDELEQRVAERTAELERSFQELNKFTYVASHDLKAPLRGVKQLAGWIDEDAGHLLPAASRAHLAKLYGRIERMEKFLDDLLLYSRLERHYYQTEEQVDVRALLQEIIELLAPPPGFTITLQEPLPVLVTHRMPLGLTFKNLIENALKHHDRAEGQIEVSARETDSLVEFSVTDDGPGIDPAFHSRIFQIFQTLRPRDERESTGAGLAIVQKAVEGQGGTITVSSAPGQGATFRFTWPKKQEGF
jgi:PAS domain S-box-containing protein